jgi:hypothetical protein
MPSGVYVRDAYSLADIARMLGRRRAWIYRNERWKTMIEKEGMPAPMTGQGFPRFHKPSIDAWLGRNHPLAPKARVANDSAPLATPQTDAEHQAFLHQVYGRRSA